MDIYEHFNIEKPTGYYVDHRSSWVDRLMYDIYNYLYGNNNWSPEFLT